MRNCTPGIIAVLSCLLLSACGGSDKGAPAVDPLTPIPGAGVRDLSDDVLISSMQSMMERGAGPANSRFDYVRIDLDGDGRRDALVHMKAPYQTWCELHGCTMYVMRAGVERFDPVSKVRPVRPPMVVSNETTNGWKDIIIRVDGRWSETRNVALKFDGRDYPVNPERAPKARQTAFNLNGTKVFR